MYLHREIWEQAYGAIPDGSVVCHIDGNRENNKLDNLICCTRSEAKARSNIGNNYTFGSVYTAEKKAKISTSVQKSPVRADNKCGYKGVFFNKQAGKYQASICVCKKRNNLGLHTTAEEAALAYNEAAIKYFGSECYLNKI